ncbi:hypothetical protein L0B53_00595 [Vibrio sp. SS-MA-C1-2]|uniref:hypothetical protein n=1 Tax=Vibrio sp. SS-MA-C1-2 TaxID=2908646 RepID=UPI001F3B6063|nr:hypothetical protein [Vibrio sp. SS-MA-C1-2]UJF17310.1 hypothetical protein L0B53_00595 [Vibrio sp. SS-MA-C1-2]
MNYKIEYNQHHTQYLTISPRKATIMAKLITVRQGALFIRLGKNELLIREGESFWLPFDCLHAVTSTPDTIYDEVLFSPRLIGQLPIVSGFLISALFEQLLFTLASHHSSTDEEHQLLNVLFQQIKYQTISLNKKDLSRALNHNIENIKEFNLCKEVVKQRKSGTKWSSICRNHHQLSEASLLELLKLYCSPDFIDDLLQTK